MEKKGDVKRFDLVWEGRDAVSKKKKNVLEPPYREIPRAAEKGEKSLCTQFVPEADIVSSMCLDDNDGELTTMKKLMLMMMLMMMLMLMIMMMMMMGAILPIEKRTHHCEGFSYRTSAET